MQPLNVVIASNDSQAALRLAASLRPHFRSVAVALSMENVRHAIAKNRAAIAVVDLEMASMEEVARLCQEFEQTQIVCTHRVPDEEMWAQSLAAGALDCCHNADVAGIVQAVHRNVALARGNAA